jgi:hypothetical protein
VPDWGLAQGGEPGAATTIYLCLPRTKATKAISYRLHNKYPVFNLIITDRNTVFMHIYNTHLRGGSAPAFFFDHTNKNMVDFFIREFDLLWEKASLPHAKENINEKID